MEKQPDSVNIATVYNYNGLDDYQLNHLTRYAKGSEFMISLSGSTLSSTPGIKFHYTDIDSVEHITQACTTTGTIPSVAADLFNLINIEPELDVEWVSGSSTSFIVSGNKGNAILPIAAKVSYNKFEDLTITITALEETEQISQHFHHYGNSQYELTNHLGNVQSVVSNRYLFANETIHEEDFSTDFWGGMTIWGSSGLSVNTNNGDLTATGSNGYVTLPLGVTPSVGHELRFDLADASSSITVRIRNTTTSTLISSETFTNGTDHKYQFTPNGDIQIEWYTSPNQTFSIDNVEVIERGDEILADVRTYQDYYPGGMIMPGRVYNSPEYRYGFNGMEKDDEIKGSGNSLDFGARVYDSRLVRWLSLDPSMKKYPGWSPYNFTMDNPILYIDPDGKDSRVSITKNKNGGGTITITTVAHVYGKNAEAIAEYSNSTIQNLNTSSTVKIDGKTWNVNFKVEFKVNQDLKALDPNNQGLSYSDAKGVDGVEKGDNFVCSGCLPDPGNFEDADGGGSRTSAVGSGESAGESAVHGVFHNIGFGHTNIIGDLMNKRAVVVNDIEFIDQQHFENAAKTIIEDMNFYEGIPSEYQQDENGVINDVRSNELINKYNQE